MSNSLSLIFETFDDTVHVGSDGTLQVNGSSVVGTAGTAPSHLLSDSKVIKVIVPITVTGPGVVSESVDNTKFNSAEFTPRIELAVTLDEKRGFCVYDPVRFIRAYDHDITVAVGKWLMRVASGNEILSSHQVGMNFSELKYDVRVSIVIRNLLGGNGDDQWEWTFFRNMIVESYGENAGVLFTPELVREQIKNNGSFVVDGVSFMLAIRAIFHTRFLENGDASIVTKHFAGRIPGMRFMNYLLEKKVDSKMKESFEDALQGI